MRKSYIYSSILIAVTYFLFNYTLVAQEIEKYYDTGSEKYLILFNPSGTEIYTVGSEVLIEWEYKNVSKIAIQYLTENNNWKNIASNIDVSKKKYNWIINSSLPKIFKVRIIDLNDSSIFHITPYYVQIISKSLNPRKKTNFELKKTSSLSKLKIMPLGNSITRGYTFPPPENINGYRKQLKTLTEENGLNIDFVGHNENGNFDDNQHEGNGGWHANHWAGHSKSLLDSVTKFINANLPDIILLQIGTNDIGEYYLQANDNTIDTTVSDISKMLDSIYNVDSDITIILAKIVNREDNPLSLIINETTTTTAFNSALEIMANTRIANGDNLKLIDMENSLSYPDDLCSDGVHPDSSGYHEMADVWFSALRNCLPKLNVKIYLEGAYFGTDSMHTSLAPINLFPKENPYNVFPWNYLGTEKVTEIPDRVVDWVLVSLRTDSLSSSAIARRAGFLLSDGSIVDLDGSSPIAFAAEMGNYYVVVEHRNHLPIMSSQKVLLTP